MANINLTSKATAGRCITVVKKPAHNDQATYPASEDITAGAPIRLNTTTGRWANANATTPTEARATHLAMRSVSAGESLTGVRGCTVDGFDLSGLAFDAPVYLSDTDARLADAPGTEEILVGFVVPGFAVTLGTTADKLLDVVLGTRGPQGPQGEQGEPG